MNEEMKVPFLCGGVVFFLIMEAAYKKNPPREHKKSDHTQSLVMKGLVEAVTGNEAVPAPKDTTKYKQCKITGSINIPFDRRNGGLNYDAVVREDYKTALERMDRFVEDHIDPFKAENLVKTLYEVLLDDEQIKDTDEFYMSKSGVPSTRLDICGEAFCDLSAFLVGIMHYCLTVRGDDNCLGAATIDAISVDDGYRRARVFSGELGGKITGKIEVRMPEKRETNDSGEMDKGVEDQTIAAPVAPGSGSENKIIPIPKDQELPFLSLDTNLEKKIPLYLARGTEKYSKVKTLIFGDALVDFYDIYVCNNLNCSSVRAEARLLRYTIPDVDIMNVRREDLANVYKYVIISGPGGLGKSMMMRHLFLSSAKEYKEGGKIPLLVTVRDYGEKEGISFEDYLFSYFDAFGVDFTKEDMINLLKFGRMFLLLDGLDEINGDCINDFQKKLSRILDRYPDNQFVLSTRPMSDYYALQRFQVLDLMPFTEDQSVELIRKLNFRPDAPEVKKKFIARLESELFKTHEEFVRNPLLLTIMLMTFEEYGSVPSKRYLFYEEAFMTLAKKHDLSKGAYVRPLQTGLSVEKLKEYFAEFCARSYYECCYEFTEETFHEYFSQIEDVDDNNKKKPVTELYSVENLLYDLTTNLCLFYFEGGEYYFIHRSFQEYFCALYFSWQEDETLEEIGNLFNKRPEIWNQDETLNMLYAMIPRRMEFHCFRPFLQKKIKHYEENKGYLTFVREMYPKLLFHNLENPPNNFVLNRSVSPLYYFIRNQFMPKDMDALQLPYAEKFTFSDFYLVKKGDSGLFIDKISGDPDYVVLSHNSEPETVGLDGKYTLVGYLFSFEFEDVLKEPEKYKKFLKALVSEDCPLYQEYTAMRKYCESLSNSQPKSEKDIFYKMIRKSC